jgi:hypothetical protein
MATEPSKYAQNQFLSETKGRLPLMGEILADTVPRIVAAANENPSFDGANDLIEAAATAWNAGETILANAEAAQLSTTLALTDKLASLTRKPDVDTNSPLETWDNTIRSAVAYQGTTYTLLLPQGRATVTQGTIEQQLDALRDLGVRLSQQTGKPALVTLGTTVTAFYTAAKGLRSAQGTAKTAVTNAADAQETLRVQAAQALFAMVGFGMWTWSATPEKVDTLFSVTLLRGPAQEVPAAPADTLWDAATKTLSTTTMPDGATRLEAWRLAPGGAPERLAVGETDEALVVIPAPIVFTPGVSYQLWLTARNSQGTSEASPVTVWVAV